jgi:RNA polymerase sigma-70 factor (ECF subfamily)
MAAGEPNTLSITRVVRESVSSRNESLNERVSALYETHRDGIYRFLVAHGLSPAVAQEVTQDVFLKLFVALRRGQEILAEQGWLYGVAARSAVDYWRREGRSAWVELDLAGADAVRSNNPTPEAEAARAQRVHRIAEAMLKLPNELRLCVRLRSEGLRYREIAEILEVSVTSVSDWLSVAVERLRGAARD